MAFIRYGAACEAISHSVGKVAPEQVLDVGAMARSIIAAESPAARGERLLVSNEMGGMAAEEASAARRVVRRAFVNIVTWFRYVILRLVCIFDDADREISRLRGRTVEISGDIFHKVLVPLLKEMNVGE